MPMSRAVPGADNSHAPRAGRALDWTAPCRYGSPAHLMAWDWSGLGPLPTDRSYVVIPGCRRFTSSDESSYRDRALPALGVDRRDPQADPRAAANRERA